MVSITTYLKAFYLRCRPTFRKTLDLYRAHFIGSVLILTLSLQLAPFVDPTEPPQIPGPGLTDRPEEPLLPGPEIPVADQPMVSANIMFYRFLQ